MTKVLDPTSLHIKLLIWSTIGEVVLTSTSQNKTILGLLDTLWTLCMKLSSKRTPSPSFQWYFKSLILINGNPSDYRHKWYLKTPLKMPMWG